MFAKNMDMVFHRRLKMPNATITIYFNDKDYTEYVKRKEEINKRAREAVKKDIKGGI